MDVENSMVVARSGEGQVKWVKGGLKYRLPVVKSIDHGDGGQDGGQQSVALFHVFEGRCGA